MMNRSIRREQHLAGGWGVVAAILVMFPVIRAEAAAPPVESTGFETADGWTAGFVCGPPFFSCADPTQNCDQTNPNPDTGWYIASNSCTEPHIDTAHPSGGAQHLRFSFDPAVCTGGGSACDLTAYSPNLGSQVVGPTTISFDIAAGTDGSMYYSARSGPGTAVSAIFVANGPFIAYDVSRQRYVDTLVPIAPPGTYKNFRIEIDPCRDRVDFFYDAVLVYTTTVFQTPTVSQSIFKSRNGPDSWDIDNFSVVRGAECPPATCGNDVMELGEECDGTDDWKCPGRCDGNCACLPPGACCDFDSITCTDGLLDSDCTGANQVFHPAQSCCDVDCIPAGETYAALGVELLSYVPFVDVPQPELWVANDIWGYVSPSGREYAIIGLAAGTAFVEVSDPFNPQLVDTIPGPECVWRDIRTYGTYAYIVNDCSDGMPIVDLSQIDNGVITLVKRFTDSGFSHAHNIALNVESGYAYFASSNLASFGLVAVDLADPENPVIAGAWPDHGVHDTYVTTYTDGPYAGREIAFNFDPIWGLDIVDVTNKLNMFTLSNLTYPRLGTTHQGWLTGDKRYVLFGDESDESSYLIDSTTYVADVLDLENPQLVNTFTNGVCAIDHNLMIRGSLTYLAGYASGLRVFDTSDPLNMSEVAFFDTYPESNGRTYAGVWGVYTGLPSGIVIVSDMNRGLFVLNYDCNDNGIDDTVDIANMTSEDSNGNGLPDECEQCASLPPPAPATGVAAQSRYISIVPGSGGTETALRITVVDLNGFPEANGTTLWAGPPRQYPEEDSSDPGRTFTGSMLQCEPYFQDWGTVGVLRLFGAELVPLSDYQIHTVNSTCTSVLGTAWDFGAPLDVRTGKWGDPVPLFDGDDPGAPQPDFNDIAAVVAKFTGDPGAPIKALAQLQPNTAIPSRAVNFKDIAAAVSAFLSEPYPYSGPCACPSTVTCGATACTTDLNCAPGFCIDDFCTDECGRCTP